MNELLIVVVIFVGLPVVSYLCVKFGTAGFYRAKQMFEKSERRKTDGD